MEKWSIYLLANDFDDLRYKGISRYQDFNAKNNGEAKKKVLALTKKFISRLRRKGLFIYVHAMPRLKSGTLNGNRMIRLKDKFSNRRLLHIKNLDIALVQGYGPEALKKLNS